jgi:hypothetical protein
MRDTIERGVQVMINVCDLMEASKDLAPLPLSSISVQDAVLREIVDRLKANAMQQQLHATRATSLANRAGELIVELRSAYIQPIVRLGKRIVTQDPEFQAVVKISELTTYEATIVTATSLVERVAPFKAQFVAAGFNDNFLEVLSAKVAELRTTLAERAEHVGLRVRARAALESDYARAKELVRILGAMLRSAWKSNPDLLAQWKAVSRFPRPPKKGKRGTEVKPPVAPAPVASVATPVAQLTNLSTDTHVA